MRADSLYLPPGEISLAVSSLALIGVVITAFMSRRQFKSTERRLDKEFTATQRRLDDQEADSRVQQIVALVTHSSERNQRIGQKMLDSLDWTTVPASSHAFLKALMGAVTGPAIRSAEKAAGEVDFVLPGGDDNAQNGDVPGEAE